MTTNDWEQVQIIATTKDGQHILAISKDKFLFQVIAEMCKFAKIKDDIFEQCSLKEIID